MKKILEIDQLVKKIKTEKIKNKKILKKSSKNFEKKINKIKNKDIRNSLSQLLDVIKDD